MWITQEEDGSITVSEQFDLTRDLKQLTNHKKFVKTLKDKLCK